MTLSDIVLKEFKDKGIEVTVYESLAGHGAKCVVDTYKHDKQIRDEVMIDTLNSVLKMIADWGYEDLTSIVLRENIKVRIAQLKGEQNGN